MTPNENLDEENPEDVAGDEAAEVAEDADIEAGVDVEESIEDQPVDLAETLETLAPEMDQSVSKNSAFMGVPIEIVVSVGKARPLVSELVKLRRDSVITLDSKIDDPVEIFIGERLIARGELQEMEEQEGKLGVRLTEVADLSNGV